MNIERLKEIAAILETESYSKELGVGFSMDRIFGHVETMEGVGLKFSHGCGTVCCIAGLAAVKYTPNSFLVVDGKCRQISGFKNGIEFLAITALDLSFDEAEELFYPTIEGADIIDYQGISPSEAAKVIRNFIENKRIDGSIIL